MNSFTTFAKPLACAKLNSEQIAQPEAELSKLATG